MINCKQNRNFVINLMAQKNIYKITWHQFIVTISDNTLTTLSKTGISIVLKFSARQCGQVSVVRCGKQLPQAIICLQHKEILNGVILTMSWQIIHRKACLSGSINNKDLMADDRLDELTRIVLFATSSLILLMFSDIFSKICVFPWCIVARSAEIFSKKIKCYLIHYTP